MGCRHATGYTPPMITALICVAAALWIPGLVLLVVCTRRAPVGFEDAAGFHVIEEPAQPVGMLASPLHAG